MLCEGGLGSAADVGSSTYAALPFYPADEPLPVGDVAYTSAILNRGAARGTQITVLFFST